MVETKVLYALVLLSTAMRWAAGGSPELHDPTPWRATGAAGTPSMLAPASSHFLSW